MPFTTTSAFGAGKANKTDWGSLAGKVVAILPDHDAPGEGHVRSVLAELRKLNPRPRVRLVRLPDLAEGEDVADWLPRVVGDRQGDSALRAVRGSLRELVAKAPWVDLDIYHDAEDETLDAQPSTIEPEDCATAVAVPEWPEPPEDVAFHGLAGRAVRAIEPHSEADPAGLLLQFLIGFGNALGSGLSVLADGHHHHANEYAVTVGDTSRARKGTAWRRVLAFLTHVDPGWADTRIIAGLSSGEGLIFEIRDPEDEEDKRGATDKRLLLVESEFGNVLRVLSREGNTLSGVLRMGWDGDTLRTLTKNSPLRATNTHVSLIGHITAEELIRYLTNVEIFNGLGNRILWACVRRSKRLPFGGVVPGSDIAVIGPKLASAVAAARTVGEMTWTKAARKLWESEYDVLTADRPGLWGAVTARAEAHVLRLSMQYAALDSSGEIADTHVLAALAMWRFCDRSARHLFGGSVGDKDADEILANLRQCARGIDANRDPEPVRAQQART